MRSFFFFFFFELGEGGGMLEFFSQPPWTISSLLKLLLMAGLISVQLSPWSQALGERKEVHVWELVLLELMI